MEVADVDGVEAEVDTVDPERFDVDALESWIEDDREDEVSTLGGGEKDSSETLRSSSLVKGFDSAVDSETVRTFTPMTSSLVAGIKSVFVPSLPDINILLGWSPAQQPLDEASVAVE